MAWNICDGKQRPCLDLPLHAPHMLELPRLYHCYKRRRHRLCFFGDHAPAITLFITVFLARAEDFHSPGPFSAPESRTRQAYTATAIRSITSAKVRDPGAVETKTWDWVMGWIA